MFLGFWPFGNVLCKAVVSIDYYNMFTSTFTLTVMSIDRYVAVCHPVKALDMRTPHKAKVPTRPDPDQFRPIQSPTRSVLPTLKTRPVQYSSRFNHSLMFFSPSQVVNICVWVLASAFGVPAMVMGNVEEEQEHNSK